MLAREGMLQLEHMVSVCCVLAAILEMQTLFRVHFERSCHHYKLFSLRLCSGYGGFPNGGQLVGLGGNGNIPGKYGELLTFIICSYDLIFTNSSPL